MGLAIRRTSPVVLALCWALLTLEGYDIVVFGAAVPALRGVADWHLSQSDIGLIGSVTILGMLLGALAAGTLADRRGRRPTLLISVVVFSAGMLLCATAPTPEVFGVGRLVVGFGTGVVLPSTAVMVAEFAPANRRNFHQGLAFSGIGVGGAVSALVAIAYGANSFRMTFIIGVLPAIVLLPALLRWLPESVEYLLARGRAAEARAQLARSSIHADIVDDSPESGTRGAGSWRSLFGSGLTTPTLLFWATVFMNLLTLYSVFTWLPALMTMAGYNLGRAIGFLLALNLGLIAGALTSSWLADRFGTRRLIVASFLSAGAGFVLLAQNLPSGVAYVVVAIVGAGTIASQLLTNAYIAATYPTAHRGTALGSALGVGRLGGVLGPSYVGWLLSSRYVDAGFYGLALPALLGTLFITAVPKRVSVNR